MVEVSALPQVVPPGEVWHGWCWYDHFEQPWSTWKNVARRQRALETSLGQRIRVTKCCSAIEVTFSSGLIVTRLAAFIIVRSVYEGLRLGDAAFLHCLACLEWILDVMGSVGLELRKNLKLF